jgi:hypothetical protein
MAGLVAAGVVAIFVLGYARSSRRKPETSKTPRERLLEDLAGARSRAGYDMKEFQGDVYKILVTYIDEEYNIDAANLKADELARRLTGSGISENRASRIQAWLARAEKDKYSPVSAGPGETVRLESEIREFFEKW